MMLSGGLLFIYIQIRKHLGIVSMPKHALVVGNNMHWRNISACIGIHALVAWFLHVLGFMHWQIGGKLLENTRSFVLHAMSWSW